MASSSSPLQAPARPRADGDLVATVARRLTPRDRGLCHVLFDHRVLTTAQITELCFSSPITAQHRLVALHRLRVLDRFRHYRHVGSDPYHYVLDAIGAELVAADRGIELKPARVRSRALALSDSQRLAHLLGVNGLFCSLAGAASRSREAELVEWWPERRCAERWGEVVRPDGFGALRSQGQVVEFFVEYDGGTETLARLAAKLDGYADLMRATEWEPWVAFWFPSSRREAEARAVLDHRCVPVVTGASGSGYGPATRRGCLSARKPPGDGWSSCDRRATRGGACDEGRSRPERRATLDPRRRRPREAGRKRKRVLHARRAACLRGQDARGAGA